MASSIRSVRIVVETQILDCPFGADAADQEILLPVPEQDLRLFDEATIAKLRLSAEDLEAGRRSSPSPFPATGRVNVECRGPNDVVRERPTQRSQRVSQIAEQPREIRELL
jgi:hypothetical protein